MFDKHSFVGIDSHILLTEERKKMSENEIKMILALTSNIRIGVLMLDRANDLKEMELCLKYPEHREMIENKSYEDKKDEMLKGTQPYTLKQFEEERKTTNGRSE